MAIGSMTTNSTVDMIDKTLSIENAPADAKATGDALGKKANKDVILDEDGNVIFYSKTAVDKLLAGKLGLHGTADNSAKWGDYERRFNEVTASTLVLVETAGKYVDLRPADSIGLTVVVASGDKYIRFADGTQICWEIGCYVDGYVTETNRRVNFPVAFASIPTVVATSNANIGNTTVIVGWESTTGFTIGETSGNLRGNTNWIAIGRWK